MRSWILAAGIAIVGSGLVPAAHAASYSVSVPVASDPYLGGYDSNIFPDYDGRFGTLGGVSISANLLLTATLQDYQTNPPITGAVIAPVSVTFSVGHDRYNLSDTVSSLGTFLPAASNQIQGTVRASDILFGIVSDSDLSSFTGSSSDLFFAFGVPTVNGAAQGLTFTRGLETSSYNLSGVVTFTYFDGPVPVPEPETLALLAGAVASLGLLRIRRQFTAR